MALSVCFALKTSSYDVCCLPGLPQFGFYEESTYYALEEYLVRVESPFNLNQYDGGYLQEKELNGLIFQLEQASRDILSKPEQWLVETMLIRKGDEDVKIEYYAQKADVETAIKSLIDMANQALQNDWALLFLGD